VDSDISGSVNILEIVHVSCEVIVLVPLSVVFLKGRVKTIVGVKRVDVHPLNGTEW